MTKTQTLRLRGDEIQVGDLYEFRNAGTRKIDYAQVVTVDVHRGPHGQRRISVKCDGLLRLDLAPHSKHTVRRVKVTA